MTPTPEVLAWLVTAMSTWSPPAPKTEPLYEPIARDILEVAFDAAEAPLFDAGDGDEARARGKTALLLASFAAAESGGFHPDVVNGKRRGNTGTVCMMQVRVQGQATDEGYTKKDLVEDRTKCIRVGLHRMRESFETCGKSRGGDKLGMYTHGRCVAGNDVAGFRFGRATKFDKQHPVPLGERFVGPPPKTDEGHQAKRSSEK